MKDQILGFPKKPCLAVVKAGNDPASAVYVRNKERACKEVGIETRTYSLVEEAWTTEGVLSVVNDLNNDNSVNAILVQLPLPDGIDESKVINAIDPAKDVDAFHPSNVAKLWLNEPCIKPCTPAGIMEILKSIDYQFDGKRAVVIGRSNIVGKPIAKLLMDAGCTVAICHSRTKMIKDITRNADLIVSAVGKAKFLDESYITDWYHNTSGEYVKKSLKFPTIIDVGINRDGCNKLCGDVDFDSVEKYISAITPVPGGVGVMTVTMLLKNTIELFLMQESNE